MKKLDYHAKLIIYGIPEMPNKTLKRLATWLYKLADDIEMTQAKESKLRTYPKDYAKVFTARLMK